jgi:tetratricopeptide (TPR) repeat protein
MITAAGLTALATLLFGLSTLGAVVLIFILVFRPSLVKRLKFKFKDFEGEFEPGDDLSRAIKGSKPVALLPAESSATDSSVKAEAPPPEPPSPPSASDPQAFELLGQGKYEEGMALARRELAAELDPAKAIGTEAFYLSWALTSGTARAFDDLEKLATRHPTSHDVQYWFANGLSRVGRKEQALQVMERALSSATAASDRIAAARTIAQMKVQLGSSVLAARDVLDKLLVPSLSPVDTANIWAAIGSLYKNATPPDLDSALRAYEESLQNDPTDTKFRFDVAHLYGEAHAEELSFFHYNQILKTTPEDPAVLNNAGVAAERLQWVVNSMQLYRRAEELGNSLASANLGYRFLGAGFKPEALALLEQSRERHGSKVHRNVLMAIGRAAEIEQQEDDQIAAAEKRARKVAQFRSRVIAAERRVLVDPARLSGEYIAGQGSNLTLTVTNEGGTEGKFSAGFLSEAILKGSFRGHAMRFTWRSATEPSSFANKSGHGEFILRADETLEGFYVEGDATTDSANADKWHPWELSLKASARETP